MFSTLLVIAATTTAVTTDSCPHWLSVMPINAGNEDALVHDVIDLGETTFIDGILYSWTLHPRGNPAADLAADYAERYRYVTPKVRAGSRVKQGILLQSTMGHGGFPSEPTQWQLTVRPDGTSIYRMCPLDERFRAYIAKACRTVSELKPDFFMVDDDARIQLDREIPGCYCPLHLAEFAKRTGREWTREELVAEIRKGKGEVFDAWVALGSETMIGYYGLIRKNIATEIPGMLCCTSFRYHNKDAMAFAKILAAPGQRPAIRGYGAPYHHHGRFDHLPLVRASYAAQRARYDKDVVFMMESDTCPQTLWSVPATRAVDHLVMLALDGMKGAKIWITRTACYGERRSPDAYRKALRKYRGLMTWAANVDLRETGVAVPPIDDYGVSEFGGLYFGRTGIPCRFGRARPGEVTALTAAVLKEMPRDEIAAILSERVLLDSSAAIWLTENGFAGDIGVRAKPWKGMALFSHEFADGRIAYGMPQQRTGVDNGLADLTDHQTSAAELSRMMSKVSPEEPPKYAAPGSILFTNARGGKVLTLAFAVPRQDPSYYAQQMLSETYKDEIVNALVRLGGHLPGGAVYRGDGNFLCLTGTTPEGEHILVLDPTDFDGDDEPEFMMDQIPTAIERLDDDGAWRKVAFRQTSEKSVIIASPVFPQHPAIFRISSVSESDAALAPADDANTKNVKALATVPVAPEKYRRPKDWKPSAPYPKTLHEIAREHSLETIAYAKTQMAKVNAVNRAGTYPATREGMDKHQCPEWFVDAKLGMFVDWGLYSIAAYSPYLKGARLYPDWYEYKSRPEYEGKDSAAEYHRKNWGEDFKPDHFIALFRGERFDAPKMMKTFRACGAKYVVPFLKHHSGFCEWDCSYTFRNTVDSPAKRDFTREMVDAARAEGLKFGVYNSQADEWEYPILQDDGSIRMKLWGGKVVDYSPDMETKASGKIAVRDFVYDYIVPQMTEFIDKYDPDLLWYDADWVSKASENGSYDITAYFYNRAEGRKEVCCNDRYGKLDQDEEAELLRKGVKVLASRTVRGDFYTDEWGDTAANIDPAKWHPWESCSGISKAYGNHWMEELDPSMVMTDREFICHFTSIVSRGGNLLLLVNLDAQGAIPKVQEERLLSVGRWLEKNGEAIYATRICAPYSTPEIDYTRSKDGRTAYAIVKCPAPETVLRCEIPEQAEVTELATGMKLKLVRDGKGAKVVLPPSLANSPLPIALRIASTH